MLARSLEDGSPSGQQAAKTFAQLSSVVGRIIASEHHAIATRLHTDYQEIDPNRASDGSSSSAKPALPDGAAHAAAFNSTLHGVLRMAGFRLGSAGDESFADRHFGDEQIWNLPVEMQWERLDESLHRPELGGYDPYAVEAAAGREVARPRNAHRMSVYLRGAGQAHKRGYFFVPKVAAHAEQL